MFKALKAFEKNLIKFYDWVRLLRYDECTIENYFRSKGYRVGTNNRIYIRELGGEPYLVKIGSNCIITNGVLFVTHDGGAGLFRDEIPGLHVFGPIEVKDHCFIGVRSIILPNVRIGPYSVVGAGSVVTKDVPAHTVVAGVPARVICSIDEYKAKCVSNFNKLGLTGMERDQWKQKLVEHYWHSSERRA